MRWFVAYKKLDLIEKNTQRQMAVCESQNYFDRPD
jgi:hypothetical protein